MDTLVTKSTLKLHKSRSQLSLRRLLLPVTSDWVDSYSAGWIATTLIYTAPPFMSPLSLIRGQGDRGELVSRLGIWLASAENDLYVQGIAAGVGMEFYMAALVLPSS